MLIPREFPFANGDLAEMAGLPACNGGWGLLLCEDERGLRYTVAGDACGSLTSWPRPPAHPIAGEPGPLYVAQYARRGTALGVRVRRSDRLLHPYPLAERLRS